MKKILVFGCGLLASFSLSGSVLAAMPSGEPAGNGPSASVPAGGGQEHPCKAIAKACEAAGFVKGGEAQGKGLMRNCIKPLMEGQTVAGVSVSPEEIQACKAKRAEHEHGQGGQQGQAPAPQ
jgi:hypothetical protein